MHVRNGLEYEYLCAFNLNYVRNVPLLIDESFESVTFDSRYS